VRAAGFIKANAEDEANPALEELGEELEEDDADDDDDVGSTPCFANSYG